MHKCYLNHVVAYVHNTIKYLNSGRYINTIELWTAVPEAKRSNIGINMLKQYNNIIRYINKYDILLCNVAMLSGF